MTNPEIGKTIEAAGRKTNYLEEGTGPAVLLLHGSGPGVTGYANWRLTIPDLATDFRVLAPDAMGFGYTERHENETYSLDGWVEHTIAFMDATGVDKAHFVGNSFGGGLTLAIANRYPDRVDRMVHEPDGVVALGIAWDAEAQSFFYLIVQLDEITSLDAVAVEWPDTSEPEAYNWDIHAANRMALTPGVVSPGEAVVPVRVWVADRLAQRFLKEPMHGSQDMRIEPSAEGIMFNLSLVPDAQFVRFALQWGSDFQVLEPDDVRHALRLAAREASDRYAPMFGP